MLITITPITYEDIPAAAECIQVAFDDDPYNKWVFDKANFNKERNLSSLSIKCEWGIKNALFYVAKDSARRDEVLGVAMWSAPKPAHQPESWSEWFDGWALWMKQGILLAKYGGRGGLRTSRYWIWKARQAEAQKALWTDPNGYYFCNIVVVRPGHQGQGIGRKLFEVVTDKADKEGRQCYLESSRDEPNTRIYMRLGFEMAKTMRCEEDGEGIDLFCMTRQPRPKT